MRINRRRGSPHRLTASPPALVAAFAPVRAAAAGLPEVEQTTMYGAPAMKLRGRFFACMATNKAADPNTVVISVGFEQREDLIAAEPEIYYLKDHYQSYPVVLIRLAKIRPDALKSLVREAWHFVSTHPAGNTTRGTRSRSSGGRSVSPATRPRSRASRSRRS